MPEHFRADESDDMHEQRARERGIDSRDDEGGELVARDIDAERARAFFAARERRQRAAEAGMADQPGLAMQSATQEHQQAGLAARDR